MEPPSRLGTGGLRKYFLDERVDILPHGGDRPFHLGLRHLVPVLLSLVLPPDGHPGEVAHRLEFICFHRGSPPKAHISKLLTPSQKAWTNVQSRAPEFYLPTGKWVCRMPLQRLTYRFTTRLPVPRAQAYLWATDYRSSDLKLAGLEATRRVERLTEDLILLTDSFDVDPFNSRPGARTVKEKLVHLYPDRWSWTSTHLTGPARYSQFLYHLTSRGPRACSLHFSGSQVEQVARSPTRSFLERRARELKQEDSRLWARFAAELAKDSS